MSEPVYLEVVAFYSPGADQRARAGFVRWNRPSIFSGLVDLEVTAALSLRVRIGDLRLEQARPIGALFDEHLEAGLYRRVHLQPEQHRWAHGVIARFDLALKSPDARHLAAAAVGGFRLVTADRQLARKAESLNVPFDLIEP